eukprot:gene48021-50591_t
MGAQWRCAEALFNPSSVGLAGRGVHEVVLECMRRVGEADPPGRLWGSILLIGGATHLEGFEARLVYELRRAAPVPEEVQIRC